jgi:predicted transposase YdaD
VKAASRSDLLLRNSAKERRSASVGKRESVAKKSIRESRVYQEAVQEGVEKERARQLQERLPSVAALAAMKIAPSRIAEILKLDLDLVLQELAKIPS